MRAYHGCNVCSKGRKHGGKLVTVPTDFSSVLDFRTLGTQLSSRTETSFSQTLQSSVISLRNHPGRPRQHCQICQVGTGSHHLQPCCAGCYLLPSLLDPQQQLDLFSKALKQFAEPPNTSNLTAHYGHLPNLWEAAQQGLFLNSSTPRAADALQGAHNAATLRHQDEHDQATAVSNATSVPLPLNQDNAQLDEANRSAESNLSERPVLDQGHTFQTQAAMPQQPTSDAATQACSALHDVWTEHRSGPSAKILLQKLRWVALGPQFNWTTRQYETHPDVKPLSQDLIKLAKMAVEACAQAHPEQQDSPCNAMNSEFLPRGLDNAGGTHHGQNTDHDAHSTLKNRPCGYWPDTALVNYYREGDTLGGHKDDAEEHDTMPIVSVSLGCDAVFLIGGRSKDETPTAMMLHSGDVLVLSGHARQCYHGLPRILPGQFGLINTHAEGQNTSELEDLMQTMRVNLSIRQI